MGTVTQRQYRFFVEHAGYAVGRCAAGAYDLAKAETHAAQEGWAYEWSTDDDADLGDHKYWCDYERKHEPHSHDAYVCVLSDLAGRTLAALGSILDPTPQYRRVVEAELALEALSLQQEVLSA